MNQSEPLAELLSKRELEILSLLVENKTNQEIADQLHLALSSVKWYAGEIYGKLGVENRKQAVKKAAELGLFEKPDQEPQSPSFPSGIVTFLFTDIEGSTPLWEQMPEAMQAAVKQHHAILRQSIVGNGGQVFQVVGDAFQAAFRLASDGLCAALSAQRALYDAHWGPTGPLKVRIGLHTGPAELDSHGDAPYQVGHALNRAARVMSAGYGGQILLSQEAADLMERELPEGVSLLDLGQHQLKGLQRMEHLYQVVAPDLPHHFPPLPTGLAHPHNLPAQLTSFIGREKELEALQQLFLSQNGRLVTLTGSGGTGKTRLALRTADRLLDSFPQGVWFVELAPISDPQLVPQTVAEVLGVREAPQQNIFEVLAGYLRSQQTLIILDNCEHVVSDAAELVGFLLHRCPHLHILATSREILGVAGEIPFRVPSLSLPKGKRTISEMESYEAVRLFVERAQVTSPGFVLNEGNAPLVAQICQRLDGIPLAIELAAARTRMLSLDQIAARLDQAFRLLTGGSRSAMPRHQTLRALIDWSYNLLSEAERILLQRLSVFAGGWELAAAEEVCADNTLLPTEQILDLLGQLIDKSLVQLESGEETSHEDGTGEKLPGAIQPRYRMLETVRQYAHERLVESGEAVALRERHLDYFLAFAVRIEATVRSRHIRHDLDLLDRELDNLRLALEWALSESVLKGLTLATTLYWFWRLRDHQAEGVEWLTRLLAAQQTAQRDDALSKGLLAARGRALYTIDFIAIPWLITNPATGKETVSEAQSIFQMLCDQGEERFRRDLALARFSTSVTWQSRLQCLQEFETLQDAFYSAECLMGLAAFSFYTRDVTGAARYNDESLVLRRKIGDLDGEAWGLFFSALLSIYFGKYEQAIDLAKKSLQIYDLVGNLASQEFPRAVLRGALMIQGDTQHAQEQLEIDLAMAQNFKNTYMLMNALCSESLLAWSIHEYEWAILSAHKALDGASSLLFNWNLFVQLANYVLGRVALTRAEHAKAREYLVKTFEVGIPNHSFDVFRSIQALGVLAAAQQQYHRAAVLFGAQVGIAPSTLNLMCPAERGEYDQALAAARAGLGEGAFIAAWDEGKTLTEEQLRRYAHEFPER
jgi:predicted ATPase/class 3 adenylate cyclase